VSGLDRQIVGFLNREMSTDSVPLRSLEGARVLTAALAQWLVYCDAPFDIGKMTIEQVAVDALAQFRALRRCELPDTLRPD
jgi:hypothetical protein